MGRSAVKVRQLNQYVGRILKTDPILSDVSVIGEISNLKFHSSGHVYFSLKDDYARVGCFLAAPNLEYIKGPLEEGMEVIATGYISVYERTKEIGILRAIGASKHNISSIFNAETFIIGLLSGVIGVGFSYLVIPPINAVLHHFTGDIPLSAELALGTALLLIALSIVLTLIGGLIPARAAAKKDPVEALRSE